MGKGTIFSSVVVIVGIWLGQINDYSQPLARFLFLSSLSLSSSSVLNCTAFLLLRAATQQERERERERERGEMTSLLQGRGNRRKQAGESVIESGEIDPPDLDIRMSLSLRRWKSSSSEARRVCSTV
jgi:hypothetical protein